MIESQIACQIIQSVTNKLVANGRSYKEQLSTFEREGMLCIPDFLTPEQTAKLLAESKTLLSNCDLSTHPKTTFKTADDDHIGDKYF